MHILEPEELQRYAEEYGMPLPDAERDYVACCIASAIGMDEDVWKAIAFKGGFVLRYGYNSSRASKDIDATVGRKTESLSVEALQKIIKRKCAELRIRFGLEPFLIQALSVEEMIAEKWRCLIERSPRRPSDLYDLWYYWTVLDKLPVSEAWVGIVASDVRELVPQKIPQKVTIPRMVEAIESNRSGWEPSRKVVIPVDAPQFDEVKQAITEAAREWTPWARGTRGAGRQID
jgi:predicted nucleotidyltransferase component of viral defense system